MIQSIAIVSLFGAVLGEEFARHEVKIRLARLAGYSVHVRFCRTPCVDTPRRRSPSQKITRTVPLARGSARGSRIT